MDGALLPPPPPSKQHQLTEVPLKHDADMASSKEERKLYKMFVNAAYQGDLETIKRMLESNVVPVDCRYICKEELEPEPLPAGVKRVIMVEPTEYYTRNGTALHAACEDSLNVAVVQELLNAGAQVNLKDKYGATPFVNLLMHRKDILHQVEITHLLLAAGCNINAKGNDGCTLLMCVGGEDGMEEIFSVLINARSDVTCQSEHSGLSVLHACCCGNSTIQNF